MSGAISIGAIPAHTAAEFSKAAHDLSEYYVYDDFEGYTDGQLATDMVPRKNAVGGPYELMDPEASTNFHSSGGMMVMSGTINSTDNPWGWFGVQLPDTEDIELEMRADIGGNNLAFAWGNTDSDVYIAPHIDLVSGFNIAYIDWPNNIYNAVSTDGGFSMSGSSGHMRVRLYDDLIDYEELDQGRRNVVMSTNPRTSDMYYGPTDEQGSVIRLWWWSIKPYNDPYKDFIRVDNFTDADGTPLDSSTGGHIPDKGPKWTAWNGGWIITSNQANNDSAGGAGQEVAVIDVGSSDYQTQVDVDLAPTGNFGVVVRGVDSDNYWVMTGQTGSDITVYSNTGGSFTAGGTSVIAGGLSSGLHVVVIDCTGTTLTFYLDDTQEVQITDDSADLQNGSFVGIRAHSPSDTGTLFNDFFVTNNTG